MTLFHVIILSIIEGLTEFLPISSTGHLILASHILAIPQTSFTKSFEIFIQLGAICAVSFLYWKKILEGISPLKKLFVAFLPTALVGFTLYPVIKNNLLESTFITTVALGVGGIIIIAFEKLWKGRNGKLSMKKSFIIGCVQALSVIPGVSRAAATIIGGISVGLSRKEAVEFSFLLAIPTMAAATGYDLVRSSWQFSVNDFFLLGLGFIGAFVSAILAVRFFVRFVVDHSLTVFGVYRIALAGLLLFL